VRFTRALVRPPAHTYAAGITSAGLGAPDLALALEQHEAYCRTLERFGLTLVRLEPDPHFPDSTFVEDTSVITSGGAMLTRPGAASRSGEVTAVAEALRRWHTEQAEIASPGTVDGGDVCEAGDHFFIGLSRRTNQEGADQLARWLARQGFDSSLVDVSGLPGLLHLKSGLSWLGGRRLMAARDLGGHREFQGWEVIPAPEDEGYAANCIRIDEAVLVAQGYPATKEILVGLGLEVVTLDMSEYRKMDGGLSCLSLRW
jgi:dimethylargininase